jgi:hypothetical protein
VTQRRCEVCGREPLPGRAVCSRCNRGIGRDRGSCVGCAKPDKLLDYQHRCRWCRERARKRCPDCGQSDILLVGADGERACDPCALRRHLDRILPADGTGPLHPLREVILRAEPLTTRRWLTRTRVLLQDLDAGRIPLTHESLDALPKRKAAEHLRALLITTGILDPDPGRALRRLENRIPDLLAPLSDEHRRLATRWIRWAVLPHLRTLDGHDRLSPAVSYALR